MGPEAVKGTKQRYFGITIGPENYYIINSETISDVDNYIILSKINSNQLM